MQTFYMLIRRWSIILKSTPCKKAARQFDCLKIIAIVLAALFITGKQ